MRAAVEALRANPGPATLRIPHMKCDQLYYDGQCSLCVAEMGRLREHADDQLELIDIHSVAQTEALANRCGG